MFSGHLPPLLLHAGGGGGTGDMPCLPHLKATNTVRMISIVKIQVRIELRKSERLPLLKKFSLLKILLQHLAPYIQGRDNYILAIQIFRTQLFLDKVRTLLWTFGYEEKGRQWRTLEDSERLWRALKNYQTQRTFGRNFWHMTVSPLAFLYLLWMNDSESLFGGQQSKLRVRWKLKCLCWIYCKPRVNTFLLINPFLDFSSSFDENSSAFK